MPKVSIKLALLSKGVQTYKVDAGTTIKDFLKENGITAKGDIMFEGEKVKTGTTLKSAGTLMLVPKVDGA